MKAGAERARHEAGMEELEMRQATGSNTCISREVLGQRERVTRQALEELEMMAGHWVKHLYKS